MGVKRSELKVGRRYSYGPMYPGSGFKVSSIQLPGFAGYDGGVSGVAILITHGDGRKERKFFLCKTEDEFWSNLTFRNAVDVEDGE